jgi:hypothetical protein
MAIEALKGLSDEQLFNEANADDAPAEEAGAETVEASDEQPEEQSQARDDHGRFASEEKPQAAIPSQEEQPRGERIPLAEYLSEREKRQTYENELKAERERRQYLEQRLQQQSAPAPEARAAKPDPLLDPDGYAKFIREEIRNDLLMERREESLQRAREANQKDFDEAYIAAQRAIDPALKARMQNSRDPGRTLLEWHREQKTRAEVGSDPNAYFDKRLEAYLADPANQAKVVERIRGGIQPAGNGKPGPTSLPPSLTRATNAGSAHIADDDDVSDEGLWRHANAQ